MENNRQMDQYSFDSEYAAKSLTLNQYISRTFGWMFVGLLVTFALAWFLAASGAVFYLFAIPAVMIILLVLEIGVVLLFSARIRKQSVNTSRVLFFVYSLLNGVVFSVYFVVYEVESLIAIFGLTALFFGLFALYKSSPVQAPPAADRRTDLSGAGGGAVAVHQHECFGARDLPGWYCGVPLLYGIRYPEDQGQLCVFRARCRTAPEGVYLFRAGVVPGFYQSVSLSAALYGAEQKLRHKHKMKNGGCVTAPVLFSRILSK